MLGLANGLEYPNLMADIKTINVNRTGRIIGSCDVFNTARTSSSGVSVTDSVTSSAVVQYIHSSGRGACHRMSRVYLHFNTSGVSSATSVQLLLHTNTSADPNDSIILKSTAFGGDGGTALAASDFYSSIDYGTAYSAELTSYEGGSGAENYITLTSDAVDDIKDNDNFTLAIVNHDYDYANTAGSDVADDVSIDLSETPQLIINI